MFGVVLANSNFQGLHHKRLMFISLLVVVLVCSLFVFVSMSDYSGASLPDVVHVKNESELKNAINNASTKATTIALNNDITLTDTIIISNGKDITLTSNKASGYCKLIGSSGKSVISVKDSGLLKIDGIIITHTINEWGRGVNVLENGLLIMYSGEISGNSDVGTDMPAHHGGYVSAGGGVYNKGVFEMYGGKISGNTADKGNGGGVFNMGTFKMFGGEITGNSATMSFGTDGDSRGFGGGVCNNLDYGGTFEWVGGVISGNIGGDVYPSGSGGSSGGNSGANNDEGDGSSDGNWITDDNNGANNANSGNNGSVNVSEFSLRDFVFIGVGIAVVIVGVVVMVLLFSSKKELEEVKNSGKRV